MVMPDSAIDLSLVPAPNVIEPLDFEAIFNQMVALVRTGVPGLFDGIPGFDGTDESDPSVKVLQVAAYSRLLDRQRVNDGAKAVMVAYAEGSDLDNLGILFRVLRLSGETDAAYRERIILAPDGFSVAGPEGAYIFLARSADARVVDATVASPSPGEVVVTILSTEGDGTASDDLIAVVTSALSGATVRPLTDLDTVQAAEIVDYVVVANIWTYAGPDKDVVMVNAQAGVSAYIASVQRLGRDVTYSGLLGAMQVTGVQRVELISPSTGITISDTQAARCTATTLTWSGTAA